MSSEKLYTEIFEDFDKAQNKNERIAVLRKYDHPRFRQFLAYAFNDAIQFDVVLPEKYRPATEPAGLNHAYLDTEVLKLYRFIKGHPQKPVNFTGLKPEYCSQCKEPDMIDIFRKLCSCGKYQPSFNYEGLIPEYCKSCKLDGMKLLRQRMCITCNNFQATYNLIGLKPRYCGGCKTEYMINVADKCKNKDCLNCGNVKYKYYCTHCFSNLFPNDPLTLQIRTKSKENYVRDFLNENYNGFIHDKALWTGHCDCSQRRRIDHRLLIGNTLLCIETDENQHKSYNEKDEEIRYDDLYMLHSGKFIFIRFNPDKYVNKNGTNVNPCMKRRMDDLSTEIDKQMARINADENQELLELVYLFYDGYK